MKNKWMIFLTIGLVIACQSESGVGFNPSKVFSLEKWVIDFKESTPRLTKVSQVDMKKGARDTLVYEFYESENITSLLERFYFSKKELGGDFHEESIEEDGLTCTKWKPVPDPDDHHLTVCRAEGEVRYVRGQKRTKTLLNQLDQRFYFRPTGEFVLESEFVNLVDNQLTTIHKKLYWK